MIKKLLLILTVVCSSITMNAQNLFLNGDLEAGAGNAFTNWTTWGNTNLTATTVTAEVHGGTRALKAVSTVAGNDWDVQFLSDAVTTVVGTSYEVRFWIKSISGTSTMRVSTAGGTANYQSAQAIGSSWQQVTYAFTASATATKIALDLGKFADTFFIDDLEIYPLTTNNVVNGEFELGSGDIFTNWTKLGTVANLTSESTNFRNGARALKAISTGSNEWDLVMQSDAVTTEIGKYYEGAIWIKSVGGASTMRLSTSGGTASYGATTSIGTTWQRVALVFKATATTTKLNLDLGKSTETFYIDDASFNSAQTVALGLADFNTTNDKVEFYPNPVKDYLNISSDTAIKSIIINDLTGKTVRTIKNDENIQSVDLSGLNNGMYILLTDTNKQFKFLKN